MESKISTTLARYKIRTTFDVGFVEHTTHTSDLLSKQRRVEIKTKWTREKELGSGAFGVVWREREETSKELRAVKMIPKRLLNVREVEALAEVRDHPDLFVLFSGWFEDSNFIYLAMEYIAHGDLGQYIKGSPTQAKREVQVIASQVLEGLVVLHGRGICHRDMKPQNILIASITPIWVKISDFGVSKRAAGTALRTSCGTTCYKAPEQQGLLPKHMRTGNQYSVAVDLWAFGAVIHEVLTSEIPFLDTYQASDVDTDLTLCMEDVEPQLDSQRLHNYCNGSDTFPIESLQENGVAEEGIDFVKRLMAINPADRRSAKDALTLLLSIRVLCKVPEPATPDPPHPAKVTSLPILPVETASPPAEVALTRILPVAVPLSPEVTSPRARNTPPPYRDPTSALPANRFPAYGAPPSFPVALSPYPGSPVASQPNHARATSYPGPGYPPPPNPYAPLYADANTPESPPLPKGTPYTELMGLPLSRAPRSGIPGRSPSPSFRPQATPYPGPSERGPRTTAEYAPYGSPFVSRPNPPRVTSYPGPGYPPHVSHYAPLYADTPSYSPPREIEFGVPRSPTPAEVTSQPSLPSMGPPPLPERTPYYTYLVSNTLNAPRTANPGPRIGPALLICGLLGIRILDSRDMATHFAAKDQAVLGNLLRSAEQEQRNTGPDVVSPDPTGYVDLVTNYIGQGVFQSKYRKRSQLRVVISPNYIAALDILLYHGGPKSETDLSKPLGGAEVVSNIVGTNAHKLGGVFNDLSMYDEARHCFQRSLEEHTKYLGAGHRNTLSAMGRIGTTFQKQEGYDKALEWNTRAFDGIEKLLGAEHPDTLSTLSNLAGVYRDQGRGKEALEIYVRILAGREKVLGMNHPDTLLTVTKMADIFRMQKNYDEELNCSMRVLAEREKTLGKSHVDTLLTVNKIAAIFGNQGKHKEALEWFGRALAGREIALGMNHPQTEQTRNEIAKLVELRKEGIGARFNARFKSMLNLKDK